MNIVFSIAIGELHQKIARFTQPTIEQYATNIDADYLCMDTLPDKYKTAHWAKFKIFELLNDYERVIFVDNDILIRNDCPNLFDIVPNDSFGICDKTKFINMEQFLEPRPFQEICPTFRFQRQFITSHGFYANTGVMVLSKIHQPIFAKPQNRAARFKGLYDEVQINCYIVKHRVKIFDIGYRFNNTTGVNNSDDRYDSFILHYAGIWEPMLVELLPFDKYLFMKGGVLNEAKKKTA